MLCGWSNNQKKAGTSRVVFLIELLGFPGGKEEEEEEEGRKEQRILFFSKENHII